MGEALGGDFGWTHEAPDSCEKRGSTTCCSVEDGFAAQAQRFVKVGLAFVGWSVGGAGCRCDSGICVSGCCLEAVIS